MAAWCGLYRHVSWGASLVLLLLGFVADFSLAGLTQLYCSSDNTGSKYWGGMVVNIHSTKRHIADRNAPQWIGTSRTELASITANWIMPLPLYSIRNAGAQIISPPVPSPPIPAANIVLDFQMSIADPVPKGYMDTFRSARSPRGLWDHRGAKRSASRQPIVQ